MASETSHGHTEDLSFLQFLPPTGSSYRSFYDDVPGFNNHQPHDNQSNSSPATSRNMQNQPIFCPVCDYSMERDSTECAWCKFIDVDPVVEQTTVNPESNHNTSQELDQSSGQPQEGAALVAPLQIEMVLDLDLNMVGGPPRRRRRRLTTQERREVAAKRGLVCDNWRTKRIKVCLSISLESSRLGEINVDILTVCSCDS